jgi:hypothetical protein
MVPPPVAAVLLLFPITESTEAARKQGSPVWMEWDGSWPATPASR